MDINKALGLLRDDKLRDCSIDELRAMSAGSVVFIQNRVPDAVHLKTAIDAEILRKQAQEAEHRAEQRHGAVVAAQRGLQVSVERLSRPKWIEWAILVATVIGVLVGFAMLFRGP